MSLPTFTSPEELRKKIMAFKAYCTKEKKPLTFARLAVFIGCSRDTIYEYEKNPDKDPEYGQIIGNIRAEIIAGLEELLIKEGKPGQIFYAKNYGYTDKQELLQTLVNNQENYSSDELEGKIRELLGTDDIKLRKMKNRLVKDSDINKKEGDLQCL